MSATRNSSAARTTADSLARWANVIRMASKIGEPLTAAEMSALTRVMDDGAKILAAVSEACDAQS